MEELNQPANDEQPIPSFLNRSRSKLIENIAFNLRVNSERKKTLTLVLQYLQIISNLSYCYHL